MQPRHSLVLFLPTFGRMIYLKFPIGWTYNISLFHYDFRAFNVMKCSNIYDSNLYLYGCKGMHLLPMKRTEQGEFKATKKASQYYQVRQV